MSEPNYRIKYRKGNFEVEVQGDKAWVEAKFKELTSKEITIEKEPKEGRIEAKDMPDTLVELLDIKGNPKKHSDVVVVFAYWLFKGENMESFNARDIEGCYDRTRKPKPKNINQIINNNISKHYLAEAKEKKDGLKAWIITRPGEEYVEQMK